VNVPPTIGMVLSASESRAETLHMLQTTLGLEDLHDLIEVQLVDSHNARAISKIDAARRRRE
jgi:hypothetical protein